MGYYSVAKNKFSAGQSSLTADQAQNLAREYGPDAVVKVEGDRQPHSAISLWPDLFADANADGTEGGHWWCPECGTSFDAEFQYKEGFNIVSCSCGHEVKRVVASVNKRDYKEARFDEHDPTSVTYW